MNIRQGCFPIPLDLRDSSYNRTFGAVGKPQFTDNYSVDVGLTMHDQNGEGWPWSCTGQTQADNLVDEMNTVLDPIFTFRWTCYMEGHGTNEGAQIRNSLKSTQVYGVLPEGKLFTDVMWEAAQHEALQHKGGRYFNVYDDGNLDWFDAIRNAVSMEGKGASCGTPWFPTWQNVSSSGILPMPTYNELQTARKTPNKLLWHNWSCKGWITIDGVPYLMVKSWQGKNVGDGGWFYMNREVANVVFELRGAGIFMQAHARLEDIYTIKISILETVLVYLQRWLGLVRLN